MKARVIRPHRAVQAQARRPQATTLEFRAKLQVREAVVLKRNPASFLSELRQQRRMR